MTRWKAFVAKSPLTLDMSELNGNEKYCYGVELPRADKRYDSIAAGLKEAPGTGNIRVTFAKQE